jgi:hypothetical protein
VKHDEGIVIQRAAIHPKTGGYRIPPFLDRDWGDGYNRGSSEDGLIPLVPGAYNIRILLASV